MKHGFNKLTIFCYAIVSFLPLLVIAYLPVVVEFVSELKIDNSALLCLVIKYLDLFVVSLVTLFSVFGVIVNISFLHKNAKNGNVKEIKKIDNVNSEAMVYLVSYIIPIVQACTMQNWIGRVSLFILLFVSVCIYVNSSLITINPILSIFWRIYKVEYFDGKNDLIGFVISKKILNNGSKVRLNEIENNIFYTLGDEDVN